MGKRDKRVDTYIASRPAYAKPILKHLRELVHDVCPDVEETIKWSHASFTYHGILCGMAAFKAHATFGFWHPEMRDLEKAAEAMGNFGRITSLKDLPSDARLKTMIKQAMKLNASGVKPKRVKTAPKPEIKMPRDFKSLLANTPAAQKTFDAFPPSCRREYLEWITEAKRPETREKRLLTTIEWLSEGKRRHWKYENC